MGMLSIVVAVLYGGTNMRSFSRASRPMQILGCLQKQMNGGAELSWFEVIQTLRQNNFMQEATYLSNESSLEIAAKNLEDGKMITIACDSYPKNLISNMGQGAPPVLWISDPSLRDLQPWKNNDGSERVCIAAVGCRAPLSIGLEIAKETGLWVAQNGYLAVSGAADGCDTAFGKSAFGAGTEVVHILPHGINIVPRDLWGYAITACPPTESFSTARAMERNNLIYSFGHMTVVCSARYRQGGSWLGAATAIRAGHPVVVADWTSIGAASLIEEQFAGTYGQAQRALAILGARSMQLDIQSFREDIGGKLDSELNWSIEKIAGNLNSGLFQ